MNGLKRNKRLLYLCKQKIENNRKVFEEPKEYRLNYQPLTTTGEILTAGNEYINRLSVYTDKETAKDFNNFDRCYVYVEPPKTYDKFCNTADFYVDGKPIINLNEAHFYLQRMVGDENE